MSAFIVSPKCMQRVVYAVLDKAAENEQHDFSFAGLKPRTADTGRRYPRSFGAFFAPWPLETADAAMRIGTALYQLNIDAVWQRYPNDPDVDSLPGPNDKTEVVAFRFDDRAGRCSRMQALKAVHCLLYQCSEGDVPARPLFAELRELGHALADDIATSLPEYGKAEWDAA